MAVEFADQIGVYSAFVPARLSRIGFGNGRKENARTTLVELIARIGSRLSSLSAQATKS